MALTSTNPITTKAWQALLEHRKDIQQKKLVDRFEEDPSRNERYALKVDDLLLDYSKNHITDETLSLLLQLAKECNLEECRKAMFSGEKINITEGRAVLHTALRTRRKSEVHFEGKNVLPDIHKELDKMSAFVREIHNGTKLGFTGKNITDVVNIGIGGSDLGPMMVYEALTPFHVEDIAVHFVSNIDGSHLSDTLAKLNAESTLFVIASKTFTTIETMTNARSARSWFLKFGAQGDVAKHFVAVSTNAELVQEFGIDAANMFTFWDWVGGRYSLSSAIGLSVMLGVGPEHFLSLLEGMETMDKHFEEAPLEKNMPVIMALLGIWYGNFFGAQSEALLPYDQHLQHFPAYLQQASMESNGKSVDRDGTTITYQTGAILWGGAGTNSQHSFFQLLHQGTELIPCDFIFCAKPLHEFTAHHDILVANCLAQTEALMRGRSLQEVKAAMDDQADSSIFPFKVFEGNRPSNTLMLQQLDPHNLGMLIALYEHKIFTQGIIWNIYSFDQFGVELGKVLAKNILPELQDGAPGEHDSSTENLIRLYREKNK